MKSYLTFTKIVMTEEAAAYLKPYLHTRSGKNRKNTSAFFQMRKSFERLES